MAIPLGLLAFLKWVGQAFGDTVILSKKGINRNGVQRAGMVIRFWPWDQITRVSIHTTEIEGEPLHLLFAHTDPDGEAGFGFAINPKIDIGDIARIVEANGLPCRVVS